MPTVTLGIRSSSAAPPSPPNESRHPGKKPAKSRAFEVKSRAMKICILSDSHDHRQRLASAVADAKHHGAEAILHCGDVVAPSTLHVVTPFGLPIHVIHGNNTGDMFHMSRLAHKPGSLVNYYGQDAAFTLHGRRIFLVHFPHYARGMALTGDYDLVCNGHEHRAHIDRIRNIHGGETLLVDPGSVGGVGAPATYVLGDLASMEFAIRAVPESHGDVVPLAKVSLGG
jgi:putative phosphoesterase